MVHGVRMKDQIQLAHILEAFVQCFDEHLNEIQDTQFALRRVHTEHKVKRCIVTIDQFVVAAADQTEAIENTLKSSWSDQRAIHLHTTFQEVAHVVIALWD